MTAAHPSPGLALRAMRSLRCRRGATAVEFALVFPVFLLMVLGIVEVGRAMWIKSAMEFACEEAARFALVNEDLAPAQIATFAEGALADSGLTGAVVNFNAAQDAVGGITFMTVTATHVFQPLVAITGMPEIELTTSTRTPQNN